MRKRGNGEPLTDNAEGGDIVLKTHIEKSVILFEMKL